LELEDIKPINLYVVHCICHQEAWLEKTKAGLLEGQYNSPVRVIGFNVAEGWVRDVSEDVARELRQRCAQDDRELPESVQPFVAVRWGRSGPAVAAAPKRLKD
jgi:hypothetical protein